MSKITPGFLVVVFMALGVLSELSPLTADPDPERYADEIARFEKERMANPPPVGAVLCVGSSSMRMWHDRIAEDLEPLTVIPRGFGGSQFSDVNHYFEELVAVYKPRAVLIYEGDNDVAHGKSPDQVLSDFKEFQGKVEALDPAIRIYVIGVKPSTKRWHMKDQIQETNRLIRETCENDEQLTYIDVSKFLLDESGNPMPDTFISDGLHLNRVGYNLWAGAVALELIPGEREFESK